MISFQEYLGEDKRVIIQEGINLKNEFELDERCDFFVMDLSFISIKLVISNIKNNLKPTAEGVLLIKPQFEVGKEKIQKNGLVKSEDAILCSKEMKTWLDSEFSYVSEVIESPVKGKTGNTEYLVFVRV
jgi:23S rRNA (cytidine1920-2'-O)/16S rRNA (cytidine1409-2'-O)-methyltransferase